MAIQGEQRQSENIGTYSGMGRERVDAIRQSGEGLIRCHGHDSIPHLGLSPQNDNVGFTLSVCGHCLSLKSLVSEYIRLTFSVGQPIFFSFLQIVFTMSSGNITDGSNHGNSADKINWKHVTLPNLLEQVEDSLEIQITEFNEQLCR